MSARTAAAPPLVCLQSKSTAKEVASPKGSGKRSRATIATKTQLIVAIEWAKRKFPERARLLSQALPNTSSGTRASWDELKEGLLLLLTKMYKNTKRKYQNQQAGALGGAAKAANTGGGEKIAPHKQGQAVTHETRCQIIFAAAALHDAVAMILKAADPTAMEAARAKGGGGAGAGGGGGGAPADDAFGAIAASMLACGNNEVVLLNALTHGAGEDTIRQTLAFHGNHPGYVPKAASGRRGPPPGTGSTVPDTHKTAVRAYVNGANRLEIYSTSEGLAAWLACLPAKGQEFTEEWIPSSLRSPGPITVHARALIRTMHRWGLGWGPLSRRPGAGHSHADLQEEKYQYLIMAAAAIAVPAAAAAAAAPIVVAIAALAAAVRRKEGSERPQE